MSTKTESPGASLDEKPVASPQDTKTRLDEAQQTKDEAKRDLLLRWAVVSVLILLAILQLTDATDIGSSYRWIALAPLTVAAAFVPKRKAAPERTVRAILFVAAVLFFWLLLVKLFAFTAGYLGEYAPDAGWPRKLISLAMAPVALMISWVLIMSESEEGGDYAPAHADERTA